MHSRKPQFLVIEDDSDDLFLLRTCFKRSGLDVDLQVAADGLEALRILESVQQGTAEVPDLVILDLNLPGLSGLDLLRCLRTKLGLTALPVVVLSSSVYAGDVGTAREIGISGYFEKPLSRDSVDRLRQLLNLTIDRRSNINIEQVSSRL